MKAILILCVIYTTMKVKEWNPQQYADYNETKSEEGGVKNPNAEASEGVDTIKVEGGRFTFETECKEDLMRNNSRDTAHWIGESVRQKSKSASSGRKDLLGEIFEYPVSETLPGLSSDPY